MKKTLLIVLCLVLSLSMFSGVSFAAGSVNTQADFLNQKGILTGSNGDLMLNQKFPVEQLMTILARLSGEEATAKNFKGTANFKDVPKSRWSAPYIAWAKSTGLAKGNSDGTIGYKDNVTAQRLAAFLLRILGYDDVAYKDVMQASKDLGLFDLVSVYSSEQLLRGDVAKIIYQALYTHIKGGDKLGVKLGLVTDTEEAELEPADISKISSPAVVYIEVYDSSNQLSATGSGFIVDKSGKIVTNYHVISQAASAKVYLVDGTTYNVASVLAYNKDRDVAVLKINGSNLPTVVLGDSGSVMNGQKVVAIGSPKGMQNSISSGLISNKDRIIENQHYLQTDAAISPGSSGGALLNYKAEVVGVTCAMLLDSQNINLAIPINDIKQYINGSMNISLADLSKMNKPAVPTGLRIKATSSDRIDIGWDQVSGADYYYVYYSDYPNGPFCYFDNDDGSKMAIHYKGDYSTYLMDIDSNTTVYFKVTAVTNGVESDFSSVISAT
ncbi:MAG: trypsin-like peptidase domain-containing protein, partial [Bacillota bacterium]|nr:trypsin-like peptidase domain-containing protein [Bacillota bacterium]